MWSHFSQLLHISLDVASGSVQLAHTQDSGTPHLPVYFSLGWIACTFSSLFGIALGRARSPLPPDYPCKLFNLSHDGHDSYPLESDSLVVGRLFMDLVAREARNKGGDQSHALKISVFAADPRPNDSMQVPGGATHRVGSVVSLAQVAVAVVPCIFKRDPGVLLITLTGLLLVKCYGDLPKWTVEKQPVHRNSEDIYALTRGKGSRDIIVIVGNGCFLDLDCLADPPSPRHSISLERTRRLPSTWRTMPWSRLPLDSLLTHLAYLLLCVLWMPALLAVYVSDADVLGTLALSLVCILGAVRDSQLVEIRSAPTMQDIPLRKIDEFSSGTAMDEIMDFQMAYEKGRPLLREFFPDGLRGEAEARWWDDIDSLDYDLEREKAVHRGRPPRLWRHSNPRRVYHPEKGETL